MKDFYSFATSFSIAECSKNVEFGVPISAIKVITFLFTSMDLDPN